MIGRLYMKVGARMENSFDNENEPCATNKFC